MSSNTELSRPLAEGLPRRSRLILAIGVGWLVVGGCSDPIPPDPNPGVDDPNWPPDDYVLPEPDTSLDPARLVVGDVIAMVDMVPPCSPTDELAHMRGRDEWVLVDVHFGYAREAIMFGSENVNRYPYGLDDEVDIVTSWGGRVLFQYEHLPIIRARMLLSQIVDMVDRDWREEGGLPTVRNVPDPARYDVDVRVWFSPPGRNEADVEFFESIGGKVRHSWHSSIVGTLPHRSYPAIRSRSGVVTIGNYGWVPNCFTIEYFENVSAR